MRKLVSVLAATLLTGCASIAGAGSVADVAVINRTTGERLQVYRHGGRMYVEGKAGERYAVELRNRTWLDATVCDLLRRHRTALVLVDMSYMPHPAELASRLDLLTTDFLYARLIGDRKAIEARTKTFDKLVLDQSARLEAWGRLLASLRARVDRGFIYANNHYAGHAPDTIRRLMELVGD